MKSFALDEKGDLLILNNEIVMANGSELLRQKVEKVLNTNKGEWSLNIDEGIDFDNILGKGAIVTATPSEVDNSDARINSIKSKENALNAKLARRLDGES